MSGAWTANDWGVAAGAARVAWDLKCTIETTVVFYRRWAKFLDHTTSG
jgi:hypothetical protein